MKEAMFYKKLGNGLVQCQLCPRKCIIKKGETGECRVRKNIDGKLYSLVYGHPVAVAIDPIEKKPLYHFLPGSSIFSIGTAGCNLHCKHCQNAWMSQSGFNDLPHYDLYPEEVVKEAKKFGCESIAYTYNEPTVFYEYVLDTARLAKSQGLRNVIVSAGFINKEPLLELAPFLDAANIDLKVFDDKIYRELSDIWLEPVLDTIKILIEEGVWVEITNLLIPGINDSEELIEKLVNWIKNNLGENIPLHFTAFYPAYKLSHLPPTPLDVLLKAREIAKRKGLNFVYLGNIEDQEGSNTYCHKCGKLLIRRGNIMEGVIENHIREGRCKFCKEKIPGVWR